jgi:hypothetical protein
VISPKLEQQLLEAHKRLYAEPRHRAVRRRAAQSLRVVSAVGVTVAALAIVALLGSGGNDPEQNRPAQPSPAPAAQIPPEQWGALHPLDGPTSAALRADFSVLTRKQQPRDALPNRRDTQRPALDPSLSRLAVERGSVRIYLGVASYDRGIEICAFAFVNGSGAGSSNCLTPAAAKQAGSGGFSSVRAGDGDQAQLLFRVMPDWADAATFIFEDGRREHVQVENNVLFSLGATLPRSGELELEGSTQKLPLTDLR